MNDIPVADWAEILDTIPHRYPFLLVDRITAIDDDNMWIEGYKNVSFNEPFFQGHFPGEPVMPGVLIVEAMAQVGAMLLKHYIPDPKEKLIIKAARLQGIATIDGAEAARATMLAAAVDRNLEEVRR